MRAADRWLNTALGDLETRGLLQCDRQAGKFDLHPVVRGYPIGSLSTDVRAQTGQLVADYFSSRPKPSYETVTCLEELADGIQLVQALTQAGKPGAAWDALKDDLGMALFRLERHHESLALLRPFFPDGWSAPAIGADDAGFRANVAALHLGPIGQWADAEIQEVFSIQEDIKNGVSASLSISLSNFYVTGSKRGELARSERILRLAKDVAAAANDAVETLRCDLFLVDFMIIRGALAEARACWAALASRPPDQTHWVGQHQAEAFETELGLLFREDVLSADATAIAIAATQALGQPAYRRRLLSLSGDWHRVNCRDVAAVQAYASAIEMAHTVGLRDTRSEAGRGLSLARLGRPAEAEAAAASAERDPPHDLLAELYLALGDRERARHHAKEGHKLFWADGPPYTFHWQLQTCRAVLQALNEPEPQLPPYDPAKVRPIEFEADIRRLLAEHAAKKQPATD